MSGPIVGILVIFLIVLVVYPLNVWFYKRNGLLKDKARAHLEFLRNTGLWRTFEKEPFKEYTALLSCLIRQENLTHINPEHPEEFGGYFIKPETIGSSPAEIARIRIEVCIHELTLLRALVSAKPLEDFSVANFKAIFTKLGLNPMSVPGLVPPDAVSDEWYWAEKEKIIHRARVAKIAQLHARYRVSADPKDFFDMMHVYVLVGGTPADLGLGTDTPIDKYEQDLLAFVLQVENLVKKMPNPVQI